MKIITVLNKMHDFVITTTVANKNDQIKDIVTITSFTRNIIKITCIVLQSNLLLLLFDWFFLLHPITI